MKEVKVNKTIVSELYDDDGNLVAQAIKNNAYPKSHNIKYVKSTGGTTWATELEIKDVILTKKEVIALIKAFVKVPLHDELKINNREVTRHIYGMCERVEWLNDVLESIDIDVLFKFYEERKDR